MDIINGKSGLINYHFTIMSQKQQGVPTQNK